MQTVVLKGAHIVTPREVTKADLLIKGTRIARLGTNLSGDKAIDCEGCYVLPGFRDQHIHDINGFNKHLDDPQRLAKVSKALASQGVAAYIIATTAAPLGELISYMKTIERYTNSETNGLDGSRLEGANIEGTFIRKECAGAQPREYIVPPDHPEAKDILEALTKADVVRLINIAPDFGTDLIEHASSHGAIVGCGHCLATAEQLADGLRYGLRSVVHLMNGAIGRSFKPFDGGGTYEGALTLPLFVELIVDGYHVDFRYISDIIIRRIRQGRGHEVIAVTDGIFPVPEEIPEEFRIYSTLCSRSSDDGVFVVKGRVNEDGESLAVPRNTLCSSKLTMDKAFENLLNLLTVDFQGFMIDRKAFPFHDALRYTSTFTAGNQALLQGKSDDTGSIEPGKLADLAVLAIHGEPGKYSAEVRSTYVNGNILSSG